MNRFELVAEVVERQALRLTPAGVAVSVATLAHRSQQIEAGVTRDLVLEVPAVGIGAIAERLNQLDLGTTWQFSGFMAHKTRSTRSLIFHITELKELKKD